MKRITLSMLDAEFAVVENRARAARLPLPNWVRRQCGLDDVPAGRGHAVGVLAHAVHALLGAAENGMSIRDLHLAVVASVGRPVHRNSLVYVLRRELRAANPRIARSARGKYKLVNKRRTTN